MMVVVTGEVVLCSGLVDDGRCYGRDGAVLGVGR